MIDEARILEYSGPLLALLKWASMMKQFILYTIFCNVFLLPWGMSQFGTAFGQFGSVVTLLLKFLLVALRSLWWKLCSPVFASTAIRNLWPPGFLFAILAIVSSQLL